MESDTAEFELDESYVKGDVYLMLKDNPLLRYNIAGVKKGLKYMIMTVCRCL